jgi:tetratricopeptide (TPR) repeat protein
MSQASDSGDQWMLFGNSLAGTLLRLRNCLALALVLACARFEAAGNEPSKLVIPDYPTAKEQYQFALIYERSQFLAPEMPRRKEQVKKVCQCYQRVIDDFPQDGTYAPRAYLQLGDCAMKVSQAEEAMQYYRTVLAMAPNDEYLQARALFSMAQVYDSKKEYETGKTIYKDVMDRFGTSSNGGVRSVVSAASSMYYTVHEQPAKKSKWSLKRLFSRGEDSQHAQ